MQNSVNILFTSANIIQDGIIDRRRALCDEAMVAYHGFNAEGTIVHLTRTPRGLLRYGVDEMAGSIGLDFGSEGSITSREAVQRGAVERAAETAST